MDSVATEKLRQRGQVIENPTGEESVRVVLHYRAPLDGESRAVRRRELEHRFREALADSTDEDLSLSIRTLAVSAQTVEALLPLLRFDAIAASLRRHGVWVRVLEPMRLV